MRKTVLSLFIFLLVQNTLFAQNKIGIKFSPTLLINRVGNLPDSISQSSNKIALRPLVAVVYDVQLKENYYFSTGIQYISKTLKYSLSSHNTDYQKTQDYNLQYVQIPITLKLFTNEISLDKKLYFQIGTLTNILVYNKKKTSPSLVKSFNPLDLSLYFGTGMNFRLGLNTMLELGLSYNRGLLNLSKGDRLPGKLILKNDMLSIDTVLKF